MSLKIAAGRKLSGSGIGTALFDAWLDKGGTSLLPVGPESADHGWRQFLAGEPVSDAPGSAPVLSDSAWVESWAQDMRTDLPDDQDRARFNSLLSLAQRGEVELIVTGQQPGFLAGPLYTLYKVATAVVLAQRRTQAGRPALAVFWCGDDDDDLREALQPVGWDPAAGRIVRSEGWSRRKLAGRPRRMVGCLAARQWSRQAAGLLARLAETSPLDSLKTAMADIWDDSIRKDWNWTKLNRKAVLRAFQGHPLWVISGRDPLLLNAAGSFFEQALNRRAGWAELARARGRELVGRGWHAQIAEPSLRRSLFVGEGDLRAPVPDGLAEARGSTLLPGVMLRSLLQDALLRPSAVVAGPAEIAYLEQLRPLYADMGLARPLIFPRLFASVIPEDFGEAERSLLAGCEQEDLPRLRQLAETTLAAAIQEIQQVLTQELGASPERAAKLAGQRGRRWRKSLLAVLAREQALVRRRKLADWPGWVAPLGWQQERRLGWAGACGLWGQPLVQAVLEAARLHLEAGLSEDWREYLVTAEAPN